VNGHSADPFGKEETLMPRAIVVVPCYNESRRLDVRAIQDFGRRWGSAELLFVNDGSRDETLELLESLHAGNPRRFSFLHLAKNGGKAEAVRQGMLLAMRSGADYVGFWDADLATPLDDIDLFCRILDAKPQIQVVLGTRMRLLGHRVERRRIRYWLGRLCAQMASLALGVRIFDTQCGAKMFRASGALAQVFERPFLTRWIFDVEILARLRVASQALDETLYECPLDAWREVGGSAVKSRDFVTGGVEMLKIYWAYLRRGAEAVAPSGSILSYPPPNAAEPSAREERRQAA
jgi:dolichyl-phosphate beta-glucosyltransferase